MVVVSSPNTVSLQLGFHSLVTREGSDGQQRILGSIIKFPGKFPGRELDFLFVCVLFDCLLWSSTVQGLVSLAKGKARWEVGALKSSIYRKLRLSLLSSSSEHGCCETPPNNFYLGFTPMCIPKISRRSTPFEVCK